MTKARKVVIKTRFGEVLLSSDRKSEKMADLVSGALAISSKLIPDEVKKEEPEYTK